MTAMRLIAAAAILFAYGCADRQTGADVTSPPEGLYAVVSRTCEGPEEATRECARTQYIELVRGKFYVAAADEVALVEWTALNPTGPYAYSARPLRGHPLNAERYVIGASNVGEPEARESLLRMYPANRICSVQAS